MKGTPLVTERVQTHTRSEIIDITPLVRRVLATTNVREGMAIVYVPHTTACIAFLPSANPDTKTVDFALL
jgi:thiamine phosphate synthase YjbQ (UPF0047 family)